MISTPSQIRNMEIRNKVPTSCITIYVDIQISKIHYLVLSLVVTWQRGVLASFSSEFFSRFTILISWTLNRGITYRHEIVQETKNGILRRTSPIFRPVTFLVAFGVVLVAPHTGRCVTVAYESRARWRSPRQHNHNDVLVSSTRHADEVTRERRREGLGLYVTIVLL